MKKILAIIIALSLFEKSGASETEVQAVLTEDGIIKYYTVGDISSSTTGSMGIEPASAAYAYGVMNEVGVDVGVWFTGADNSEANSTLITNLPELWSVQKVDFDDNNIPDFLSQKGTAYNVMLQNNDLHASGFYAYDDSEASKLLLGDGTNWSVTKVSSSGIKGILQTIINSGEDITEDTRSKLQKSMVNEAVSNACSMSIRPKEYSVQASFVLSIEFIAGVSGELNQSATWDIKDLCKEIDAKNKS